MKRILLMFISDNSGHHSASLALEKGFRQLSDNVEIMNVNSFHYTNPILEKIVNRAYMSVIKRRPEVWAYLYDNPKVVKRTQKFRESIHRYNSQKTKILMERFRPHAVICTQAFPCGIIADYKKTFGVNMFLAGVLTDYAPHAYWLHDNVDMYFVPSAEARDRFAYNGVSPDRISVTGIPIDPKFKKARDGRKIRSSLGLEPNTPIILIMGGSQGIGPIREVVKHLDRSDVNFQIAAVAGSNRKLHRYLQKIAPHLNKKTVAFGYTENIDELMEISSLIVTKPGGITISEALAKGLPLLIIKPIPGHEQMNTDHLTKHKVAIRIDNLQDIEIFLKELLSQPQALKTIQERARKFAKPSSALDIAESVLARIT